MTELEALFEVAGLAGQDLAIAGIETGGRISLRIAPTAPPELMSELAAKVSAGLLEAGHVGLAEREETEVRISPRTVRVSMWDESPHNGDHEHSVHAVLSLKADRHLRDAVMALLRWLARVVESQAVERERREALAAMAEERVDRRVKELMLR